jgi:hypothetical protein
MCCGESVGKANAHGSVAFGDYGSAEMTVHGIGSVGVTPETSGFRKIWMQRLNVLAHTEVVEVSAWKSERVGGRDRNIASKHRKWLDELAQRRADEGVSTQRRPAAGNHDSSSGKCRKFKKITAILHRKAPRRRVRPKPWEDCVAEVQNGPCGLSRNESKSRHVPRMGFADLRIRAKKRSQEKLGRRNGKRDTSRRVPFACKVESDSRAKERVLTSRLLRRKLL